MDPNPLGADPAELLVHGAWMRRLAVALAGREGDDLAQEAWLTALRRPPAMIEHPRAWLGTILRNLARMQTRADSRRRAREERLAARGDEPSTDELVARAELEQLAVRLVLDLEPLYREALVLRFMRGLEPSEIARRAGVPASTVRNRIARGLEEVRRRLDERHGRRSAWLAALLPGGSTLVPSAIQSTLTTGGLLVSTKFAIGAALAAAAALLFCLRDTPDTPEVRSAGSNSGLSPAASAVPARDEPGLAALPELQEKRRALAEAPTAPPSNVAGATRRVLTGTIAVQDPRDEVFARENGSFTLGLRSGQDVREFQVAVEAGRFTLELPQDLLNRTLEVSRLVLGERAAVLEAGPGERPSLPEHGELALRARWVAETRLRVRDASIGRELDPVLVVERGDDPGSSLVHPGLAATETNLGPSPVVVPPAAALELEVRTLFVRSPGYAWGRVWIDALGGGERVVDLEPAATLRVELLGAEPDSRAVLRLYAPENEQSHLLATDVGGSRSFEIESLPPGTYRVVVEVGSWWNEPIDRIGPHVLGEASVDLEAGEEERVSLTIAPEALVAKVPFAGVLLVPSAWELGDFELSFKRIDPLSDGSDDAFRIARASMLAAAEGTLDTFYWEAPPTEPGRTEIELEALGFSVVVRVGPAGTTDAVIELPPPCKVRFACIGADDGEPVSAVDASWRCQVPEGVDSWQSQPAAWNADARRFEFRAPIGDLILMASAPGFVWRNIEVEARAGTNEFELRMERMTCLKPILRDGATEIPWQGSQFPVPHLEPLAGQNEERSYSCGPGWLLLHAPSGGLYRLVVPEIPGFEPVPDTVVELTTGRETEHVIELRRKR